MPAYTSGFSKIRDHPYAAVPYADVGDRFGVSRTHVRQLLTAAENAGWSSFTHAAAAGSRSSRGCGRAIIAVLRMAMCLHDVVYVAATRGRLAAAD
jgi:hypothetical protein